MVADPALADLRGPLGRTATPGSRASALSTMWDHDEAGVFVETLFAKHHGEIYAYLLRMLREPELAADLTQDAFIKAYKNYYTLEKPETLLRAYALINRIRLCASPAVLHEAERLVVRITDQYFASNLAVEELRRVARSTEADPMQAFGEACRAELHSMRKLA